MKNFNITKYSLLFDEPERVTPSAWIEHIPFLFLLMEITKPSLVVELGTHTGTSFNAMCQAVRTLNLKTNCYAVDTWEGDTQAGYYDDSIYMSLAEYIDNNHKSFAQLMRMSFDDASLYFNNGSIDFLHIDGLHTYEAVKHDFATWLPKMSDRGVIIMHDTSVRRDDFGVWKLWEEVSKDYISYNFDYGYGLGILVTGKNPPDELICFIESASGNVFFHNLLKRLGYYLLCKDDLINRKKDINQLGYELNKAKGELFLIRNSRTWRWGSRIAEIIHVLFKKYDKQNNNK